MRMKTSTHTALLQLDSVGIRLGAHSFGPFSLHITPGERIAILGPSGAGKSTLLKLMSREWKPTTGQVSFHGQRLADWSLSDLSRHRAVLPQSGDVAFGLQADLVVGLGRVARVHDPHLADIVQASATLAHAAGLLRRRFDTLSGGEQARIQLARVFAQLWDAHDGLILVDEPLAALDPGLQLDLLDSLEAYAFARHHGLVAILHDINQAMLGFDRLLLLKGGKLVADLPSSAEAVPALESLYGIALGCTTDIQGTLVIAPLRKPARRPAPAGVMAWACA
ncbi:ATP-binding cassette domain-containing protein [Verminephrobacter eiseniae]|nr:ATP-binding cassette domain-containing protein [Verminephrobacter eiseniae]MCW5292611.1 ATP-binding cassette domain-containing protein [Verminephrobacter eiseniae]MCW8187646.1 ATP-binding cassette domain-containing protein [Verminephrobacter eiseniae]MCW8225957.1 ATP-binding cassette domain-containing protein [Verminephrobacter eiseniae]MCW8236197.1 ATP-binding cassette domain-containing protein [Verminephrobacter eiseniae]